MNGNETTVDQLHPAAAAIAQSLIPREPTVMEMLDRAVEKGMPIEYLTQLITLKERVDANEEAQRKRRAIAAFDVAFTAAKLELPTTVAKNKAASFDSKRTGDKVGYFYEGLDDVLKAVVPTLAKHGLSHTYDIAQTPEGITVTCILQHVDGHFKTVAMRGPRDESGAKNFIQSIGSTTQYLQRYTLKAILGMGASATDDDQGGEGAKRPQAAPDAMEQRPTQPARGAEQATAPPATAGAATMGTATGTRARGFASGDENKDVGDLMHVIDLDQFFQTWRNLFPADRERLLLPLAHACAKRGEAYFKKFYVPLAQNERDSFNKPAFPDVAGSITIAEQLRREMSATSQ
jgi:hypothetical protein